MATLSICMLSIATAVHWLMQDVSNSVVHVAGTFRSAISAASCCESALTAMCSLACGGSGG